MTISSRLKRPWTTGGPFPFFGERGSSLPWVRPGLNLGNVDSGNFTTFANRGTGTTGVSFDGVGGGYHSGDVLTLVGGTFTHPVKIIVTAVDISGVIQSIDVLDEGQYTVDPPSPTTAAGGHGSGENFYSSSMTKNAASVVEHPNGGPIVLSVPLDANQSNLATILYKNISVTAPWEITCALAGMCQRWDASTYFPVFLPLMLIDPVNGQMMGIEWTGGNPSPTGGHIPGGVNIWKYTNIRPGTSESALVDNFVAFPFPDYFCWFRITNDGANLNFYISPDGVVFQQFFQDPLGNNIINPTQAGFGFDRISQVNYEYQDIASILWFWQET